MINNQDQLQALHPPKKRGRRLLLWLGRIVAGLVILSLIGAVFESVSEASDRRAYPPPGQMVDVGGYRLHIYCTGTGSPTVVIEAGLGDWSTAWGFVQTEVAKTTRVCTYDRAGSGWSESGPLPRDASQFVNELHTLLQKANLPGPFILVGHSLGGLPVRVFTDDYPSEVRGICISNGFIEWLRSCFNTCSTCSRNIHTDADTLVSRSSWRLDSLQQPDGLSRLYRLRRPVCSYHLKGNWPPCECPESSLSSNSRSTISSKN